MVTRSHYNAPSGDVVTCSVRLDSVLHSQLDLVGGIKGLSMNAMVNLACEDWVTKALSPNEASEYQSTIDRLSGKDSA